MTAAFFNFHPAMVESHVPACWEVADPAELTVLRAAAASAALSELCSTDSLDALIAVLPVLRRATAHCGGEGRMLAGANRALWPLIEPALRRRGLAASSLGVAEAWQATTTLREHRGDGHVAALTASGLSGLEAHLLAAGVLGVPPEVLRDNRGWTGAQWADGAVRLVVRGLLGVDGSATGAGREMHRTIEALTDELAGVAYAALSDSEHQGLYEALAACATQIQSSGLYPFPNPMGLPRLEASSEGGRT